MQVRKLSAVAVAVTLSGVALAQLPGPINSSALDTPAGLQENTNLDIERDYRRMRDDVMKRRPGPTTSLSPIPTSPEDITVGSEVRDKKGVVIGTILRVGKDFAVVGGPAGKVEVDFPSFAKNRAGLLINMRRAQIESAMAANFGK